MMQGKVCLVTGANAGLGKTIAWGLARLGATVIMVCRDRTRGEAARSEIQAATSSPTIELVLADLSVQQSVRELAAQFLAKYDHLDVLVNNAAVFKNARTLTADGLETMFATNYLGHFLLTNLLLPALKASPAARIIHISAPSTVALNFDDLQGATQFNALRAFGATKMGNMLFAYELARRLQGTGVTSNVLHPGLVKSSLMREAPLPIRLLTGLVSKSPEQAANNAIYLASAPEVAGVSGQFFVGKKRSESNAYSRDPQVQQRLWEVSLQLTGLDSQ
jgi:NAD(P)-dependent dehydrogenase (short-subunit alcohol dehydrogenase family)